MVIIVNGFLLTNENMIPLFCWLLGWCGTVGSISLYTCFVCISWEKIHYEKDLHVNGRYYSMTKNFIVWCLNIYSDPFLHTIKLFCLKLISFDLCSTDKEMHKRQDMFSSLKSKAKQMATSFNMSNFANRSVVLTMISVGTRPS